MTHYSLRLSGYVPPIEAWVARRLWAEGVFERAQLEHAIQWGRDLDRAWRECDRLELLLPLAVQVLDHDRATEIARGWILEARERLGELGWPPDDVGLLERCLLEATAPDVDVAQLDDLRHRAIQRAGAKAPGRHRYTLLTAASACASLGRRRASAWGFGGAADAELVGAMLAAAFVPPAERDLFDDPVDGEAFVRRAVDLAHAYDAEAAAE